MELIQKKLQLRKRNQKKIREISSKLDNIEKKAEEVIEKVKKKKKDKKQKKRKI